MREMKDSGVEWIGDVPSTWDLVQTKAVISCRNKKSDYNGATYIGLEHIESGSGKLLTEDKQFDLVVDSTVSSFSASDVLFGKLRPYLAKVAKPDFGGQCSTEILVLSPSPQIYKNYLFWYMLNPSFIEAVNSSTYGAKMPRANWSFIGSCIIPLPPFQIQKGISDYLDKKCAQVDSLITNVQTQIEKLQAYKQSLITEVVTKGLVPNVPMKDSNVEWIGNIPAHWTIIRLKHLYDHSNGSPVRVGPFGSALPSSELTDEGVWVYNQRTVLDKNFETNNTFVSEKKADELSSFAVYPKDILVTTRGSIGKTAIVPDGAPRGVLHPCVIRFRINGQKMNNELLSCIFNETNICLGQIMDMSNSTTIEVLYSYSLKEIWMPCPPITEQEAIYKRICDLMQKFDRLISIKQAKIEKLEQYKRSLIYEYVTGKKEVP